MREVSKKSVAFLLLQQIPHVHHVASIACELSKFKEPVAVSVLGNEGSIKVFQNLAKQFPGHDCRLEVLRSKYPRNVWENIKGKQTPSVRHLLKINSDRLLGYDMIVTTDFDLITLIKSKNKGGKKPIFVRVDHGSGELPYAYSNDLMQYDYWLFSGNKRKARLEREGLWDAGRGIMIGYPKFDIASTEPTPNFFQNDAPVVLYNPHFQTEFSSYDDWGLKILEFFLGSDQYNLIFAPHFNLFHKRGKKPPPAIPDRYYQAPNIHIDLGSNLSIDMTYTANADLYLGDMSSQVYEFLRFPRPCLFLNAKQYAWEGDISYQHWFFGSVVEDMHDFPKQLVQAFTSHAQYSRVQQEAFDNTFYSSGMPAGKYAAKKLKQILFSS